MSYILDALKKSEQQRGHGSIPNVQTVHSSSLSYRDEKKAYWPTLLIAAVILNFIAIVYFIVDKNSSTEIKQISTHEQFVSVEEYVRNKSQGTDATSQNADMQQEKTHTPSAVTTTKKPVSANSAELLTIEPGAKTVTKTSAHSSLNTPPVQAQKDMMSYYDLPPDIQQQLPAIIVTAHVYSSNPLQRSMIINNHFMEEDEYLIDNLILHEITRDGAIFDYEEIFFYYNMVSGWQ